MSRAPNTGMEHARRRGIAEAVIAAGGTQADLAWEMGMSGPGALKWLRRYAPDLHPKFRGNRIKTRDGQTALVRLLLLQSVEGMPEMRVRMLAAMGLSPAWAHAFRKVWAPDGLDAAIADLWPEVAAHG